MYSKQLFNNKHPLFKISKGNKISHLFGSCHSVPLDSLYTGNYLAKLMGREDKKGNILINFLNNRGTLITEFGYHGNTKYYLDSEVDFKNNIIEHYQNNELKIHEEIILEQDLYSRIQKFVKYKPNIMEQNFFRNPCTYFIKDKKLIESIVGTNIDIFHKIKLVSLANIIYAGFCFNGIDSTLALNYTKNSKYVYALDNPTKGDNFIKNTSLKRHMYTFLLMTTLINFKYRYNLILDTMNSVYLEGNTPKNNYCKDNKLVTDRNIKWIPWINRYHYETNDPLFIVGYAHLYGNYGLLNLLQKDNYNISSYDLELNTQPFI